MDLLKTDKIANKKQAVMKRRGRGDNSCFWQQVKTEQS